MESQLAHVGPGTKGVKRSRMDYCRDYQSLGSLEISAGLSWRPGLGMDRPKVHVWRQPERKETVVLHDNENGAILVGEGPKEKVRTRALWLSELSRKNRSLKLRVGPAERTGALREWDPTGRAEA